MKDKITANRHMFFISTVISFFRIAWSLVPYLRRAGKTRGQRRRARAEPLGPHSHAHGGLAGAPRLQGRFGA